MKTFENLKMEKEKEEEGKQDSLNTQLDRLFLRKRRIFLSSAINEKTAEDLIRKFWYLEFNDPGKPLLFVINSPGGSVDAGFAIWDQIHMLLSPVTTLVTGLAASMGSVLSLAASPKRRFATPHARVLIHQPLIAGVIEGQATDLDIHAKEIIRSRNALVSLYSKATGKDRAEIEKVLDRDTWMSAKEAIEFGLLDGIVTSYKDLGFE